MRIKVNSKFCSGCLSCVTYCSMTHEQYVSLAAARLHVELSLFSGKHRILICRQCSNAPCIEACAMGAMRRGRDGTVLIDYQTCNGCRECISACPLEAIFYNPIAGQVIKCDLCGGEPQCIFACPTEALAWEERHETIIQEVCEIGRD